jgi:Peroxisomal biogenesis factor 11 (PEX11)
MTTTDSSPNDKPPIRSSGLIHKLSLSTIDACIARLNKILVTSSGVDTSLTLVGYSLYFVASQLSWLQTLELQSLNNALKPSTSLASLTVSLKTLAGMCSDFRAFTRLWGMLGVWASVKRTYLNPPKDSVVNGLAWAQTATLGAYLFYENGYYLAGKGVLQGWSPQKQKRWAKISLKMFLAYVVLEWVRLFRARQLREEEKKRNNGLEKVSEESEALRKQEEAVWWRTAMIDAIYTPLSMHWASENGMLSDGWVGALMTVVGWVKFRAVWAQTA